MELANVREELLLRPHEERIATLAQIAEEVVNVITREMSQNFFRRDATLPPGLHETEWHYHVNTSFRSIRTLQPPQE